MGLRRSPRVFYLWAPASRPKFGCHATRGCDRIDIPKSSPCEETPPVPKATQKPAASKQDCAKNAAERQPVAAKRSAVATANTAPSAQRRGGRRQITALKLPKGKLSPEMDAYFKKCDEKLVSCRSAQGLRLRQRKLEAFVGIISPSTRWPSPARLPWR